MEVLDYVYILSLVCQINVVQIVSMSSLPSMAMHTTQPQKKSIFLIWETVYSLGKKPFPSHDNFFNLK